MPAGRVHDQITLVALPFVTLAMLLLSRNARLTLIVASAFLFSGLMFGPDLDIYSLQFKRWGWLRYIWIPYQRMLKHRSWLSHGPIVGTILRIVYLGVWVGAATLAAVLLHQGGQFSLDWQQSQRLTEQFSHQYWPEGLAAFVGLELGSMSHALSDSLMSMYKSLCKE
ncbi:MAG: metal-binding protein [Acaryochloridaceae cyanobacterium SU_2_1]|nr:metal-binding protein [Acaryochloridaceae cyanobacterium SU_2_1]